MDCQGVTRFQNDSTKKLLHSGRLYSSGIETVDCRLEFPATDRLDRSLPWPPTVLERITNHLALKGRCHGDSLRAASAIGK